VTKTNGYCTLSLPEVRGVHEVRSCLNPHAFDHEGVFVIIALDPNSGRKRRYSVISTDYCTGQSSCIGRELPLKIARAVALKQIVKVQERWAGLEEAQQEEKP
jgi:hypothetical protein